MRGILSPKLSPVNQIVVDLIKNLESINGADPEFIQGLINGFLAKKNGIDCLQDTKQVAGNAEVSAAVKLAQEKYIKYCNELKQGYIDILERYSNLIRNASSQVTQHKNGRYYDGDYTSEVHDKFIALTERFALMGSKWFVIFKLAMVDVLQSGSGFNRDQQRLLIAKLCLIFEGMMDSDLNDGFLKDLKKNIRHLAADLRVDCRIVNNQKFYSKLMLDCRFNIVSGWVDELNKSTAGNLKAKIDELYATFNRDFNTNPSLKYLVGMDYEYLNQKINSGQTVFSDKIFARCYWVAKDGDFRVTNQYGIVRSEQQADRSDKKVIEIVSTATSAIIGVSDGAVAGVSIFGVLHGAWQLISGVVAVSGTYCNYYLFQLDITDTLRQIFTKKTLPNPDYSEGNGQERTKRVLRLWVDDQNKEVGWFKKLLCVVLGAGSLATGAVYACLAFNVWTTLLASVATFSWLAFPVATVFAAVTFVGLTSILWTGISSLIKNPGQLVTYGKNHFYKRDNENSWQHAGRVLMEGLKLIFVTGIVSVVTIFTLGLMVKNACKLIGPVLALGAATTDSVVHLPFGFKNVVGPFDAVIEHGQSVNHPDALNPLQIASRSSFRTSVAWLVGHAISNGTGQAALLMGAAGTTAVVFGMPFLALPSIILTAGICKFFYSALPNINARYQLLSAAKVVPIAAPRSSTAELCGRLHISPENLERAYSDVKQGIRTPAANGVASNVSPLLRRASINPSDSKDDDTAHLAHKLNGTLQLITVASVIPHCG